MSKVLISVTDGQNDDFGFSRAKTENGFRKAAKGIWPYASTRGVRFRVYDNLRTDKNGKIHGELIYEDIL